MIFVDEGTMMHGGAYQALNRMLCDIMDTTVPFGGKVLVVGGDFRQTLPVVAKGGRADVVAASLKSSGLWRHFQVLRLDGNLRVERLLAAEGPSASQERRQQLQDHADWMRRIGDGAEPTYPAQGGYPDSIRIPERYVSTARDLPELINTTFGGDLNGGEADEATLTASCILAPLNEDVDGVNDLAADMFKPRHREGDGERRGRQPASSREYLSFDSVDPADDHGAHMNPPDFLNDLRPSGLPAHRLLIKPGMPVIIVRNLNVRRGLCNGTRAIVLEARRYTLLLRVMSGPLAGETYVLPRITLTHNADERLSVTFSRKQFPIKLAFALTINKAQGQTLRRVAVYLPTPVFSHGQMYTAVSRAGDPDGLRVHALGSRNPVDGHVYTRNIVWEEALA